MRTHAPVSQAAVSAHDHHPRIEFKFFEELKRRNIVRVGVLYVTVCWLILDPVHVVFDMMEAPQWARKLVLLLMVVGFPVALIIAWAFELTPTGLKPTVLVDPRKSIRAQTGRRMDRAIIVVLVLALGYLVADKYWPLRHEEAKEHVTGAVAPAPVPAAAVAAPAPAAAASPTAAPAPLPAAAPAARSAQSAPAVAAAAVAVQLPVDPSDAGAQGRAVATIVDGQVLFIRGAERFVAVGGVRLDSGDIIATGPGAFLQLEFDGGARVELGPQTQLMLSLRDAGKPQRRSIYLLAGWVKVTADPKSTQAFNVLRSGLFELTTGDNVTVTRVGADEAAVFAESGSALLLERGRGASPTELPMKPGQFYARRSQRPGTVSARPSPAFLGQIPASFRDTLPPRFDLFRNRAGAALPAADFTYADVEAWLKSDPAIRRQLAERWKDKSRDAAFRRALEANLRELPEWYPILYPPKEVPEAPAIVPTDRSTGTSPPS